MRRHRGFTLVEIAVVIVIIGLLLTMLLGISTSLIAQQRRDATRGRLVAGETALALFVAQHRRLPCPADGSLPSTDANYGLEIKVGASPNFLCNLGGTANSQQNGVAPWRSLGLTEADVTDGWGNRLTYRVHASLVLDGAMNFTYCDPGGTKAAVAIGAANGYCDTTCTGAFSPANCTQPALVIVNKGLQVRNLAGATIMDGAASTGAAYVLVSHGENRAGGYDNLGVVQAAVGPAAGTEEAKNAANLALQAYYVDDFPSYAAGTGHFDDFLVRPTILSVSTRAQLGPRAH